MPDDQAKALIRSLQKFDVVEPLIIDQKNRIVGGHQRLDALQALGVKQVPVIRKHLSESEFKALNLALNRISGEWDEQKLAPILAELRNLPEIDLTGFQPAEIDKLIREVMPEQNGREDEIPEPPPQPITEQLGRTAYGCEIDPRYVDVAVRRWEAYTGKKAHRIAAKTIQ